jgi:hypothetical protein
MVYYHADRRDAGDRRPFSRGVGARDYEDVVEGTVVGERARKPEEGDDDFMSTIAGIAQELIKEKKKHQKTLADAVHRSLQKRVEKAKYANPADSKIKVRREGLLARQNARDLKRFEAAKANKDRAILNAELIQLQGEYFRRGKYYVMQVLKDVYEMDEDVPEDLLPIAQALTQFIADALPGTFVEGGTMIGEFGLEENALATKPPRDEEPRR